MLSNYDDSFCCPDEQWKWHPEYINRYAISTCGRVKSFVWKGREGEGIILKQTIKN